MKFRYFFILLLLFTFQSHIEGRNNLSDGLSTILMPMDDYISHTVVSGETVYSLARKYETTVDEIYRLNPEAKKGIKGGQILKMPKSQKQTGGEAVQVPPAYDASYFTYTVQKGETLYRIARENEVSIETLYASNPQLKDIGLKEGMMLKIPRKKETLEQLPIIETKIIENNRQPTYTEHPVALGETIYGLSKKYNISIDDLYEANPYLKRNGLMIGMRVRIPDNVQPVAEELAQGTKLNATALKAGETMRIAILFPFSEDGGSIQKEKLVEYYEGFLLAVSDLKAAGVNANIYTFDTGKENDTKRLKSILETSELQNAHVIIGGVSDKQINLLCDFSRRTGARYIIPFGIDKNKDITSGSPNVFQMTISQRTIYPRIAKVFAEKFRNDNIIIFTELGSDRNKADFVNELQDVLTEEGIAFKKIESGDNILNDLDAATLANKNNIVIPTSSSELTLRKITGALNLVKDKQVTLFGYPDWQVYNNLFDQMAKYNTYIYCTFYLNETDKETQRVTYEYRKWYNKIVPYQFPKFAFLGYDTALFFMSGLQKYGSTFDVMIPGFVSPTLQSSIHFERARLNSGYINTGFYFVHYRPDSSVEKIEYK